MKELKRDLNEKKEIREYRDFLEKAGILMSHRDLYIDVTRYEEDDIEKICKVIGDRISFFHRHIQSSNVIFYHLQDDALIELERIEFFDFMGHSRWKLETKLRDWMDKRSN